MHDLFVALRILAVAVLLLWLLTRTAVARMALRWVMREPALLVPAAMAGVTALALAHWTRVDCLTERPWFGPFEGRLGHPGSWIWFAFGSLALAGQVGLLQAIEVGRRPDGDDFLRGIRQHTATMVLARLAIAAGVASLERLVPHRATPALVVVLLPSLCLVPVVAFAADHPGRPLRALLATLSFTSRRVGAVGGPLLAHALLILGLGAARSSFDDLRLDFPEIAFLTSGLGFNVGFFAAVADSPWAAPVSSLASLFGTVVFTTAQWIGVRHGYDAASFVHRERGEAGA